MKINQLYFVLLVCALAVAGCKKIEPPVIADPESPDFQVDLDVDGESKRLVAGDRNYYMNTSWERDSAGVHTFIGNLAQYDCLDQCGEQLTIKIRDYQQAESPFVDIIGALPFNENFAYKVDSLIQDIPDTTTWAIGALNNLGASAVDYMWRLNGQLLNVSGSNFTYTSTTEDHIEVELVLSSDTLFNTITTKRNFGAVNAPLGLGVEIEVGPFIQGAFTLNALATGGVTPYSYSWNNGSSDSSTMTNPASGEYCVTVGDGNADSTSNCIIFQNPNLADSTFFFSSIEATASTIPGQMGNEPNLLRLGVVTIEYTDNNGVFYSTELGAQAADASFVISNALDYDPNIRDEAVKQLLLDFDCTVYTETGQQLSLSSIDALFGIAYPN